MRHLHQFLLALTLLLVSCSPATGGGAGPVPTLPAVTRIEITYVPSEGIGNIAVRIAVPPAPRYSTGAGVVVVVSPFFTGSTGFLTAPDFTSLGLIEIGYLYPGETDGRSGARSDGVFDFGGENSINALRDVIRFATNLAPDKDGHYLTDLTAVPPRAGEVGLYAFAEAGIAAINALALYGDKMQNVQYLVGNENPTEDTLSSLEVGYLDDRGQPVVNPLYKYPQDFSPNGISLDYTSIRWDPNYQDNSTTFKGRPFLDLDRDGQISSGDYVFSSSVPVMFGKRYYSAALTKALLANGVLTQANWPSDLATPQETAQDWQFRQSLTRYQDLGARMPNLRVMLVFAKDDHAQVALDKPHIHQAFQGLRFKARLWVRLNPDRVYVQAFLPNAGLEFPDNAANTQPEDWLKISDWAYPSQGPAAGFVPLAAVAEMADRVHFDDSDNNLGLVLTSYSTPTP